jgi:DnaK suppressor protein
MPSTAHLSQEQRIKLFHLLQSRLADFERDRAAQLHGLTQAESARETLLQDADDARQRAGEHEVEAIVSDIDSAEYNEIRNALQRIHGADYGLCIDCQSTIPFERLQLEPQTLRCITCQTIHERNPLP